MTTASARMDGAPPHDLEAEASVLGAILLDPTAIKRVIDLLDPDDFFRENHGQIYRGALNLCREDQPIDNVTLAAELERMGVLERVGGRAQLAMLQEQTPTAANIEHYAHKVKDKAHKRRLIEAGGEAVRLGQDPTLEARQVLEVLTNRVRQVAEASSAESWDPSIPLAAAYQLPAFPLEVLPSWLSEFAAAVAEATQTPPDLAGMLVLASLAACAGGRVRLEVRSGWQEPLNLYTVVALLPGERKSAVFAEATAPLAEFEAAVAEERNFEIAEATARRKVAEKALDRVQNEAARAVGADRERLMEEVARAAREVEQEVVPAKYQLLADDATPEVTASLLAEQGGRIAIMSPEGGVFGQMAGRYSTSGQPNLDVYLKGHSGDMLRVDRKSRPAEYVRQPALTVGLAVQPDVLRSLSEQPGFRGRGLLARFLYSLPTSRVGGRKADVPPVPAGMRDTYAAEVKALARSLEVPGTVPYLLRLSGPAEAALIAFSDELEPRLGENGDLGHIADWGCKLAGAIARIAGLLHVASNVRRGWGEPVALESMQAATVLGRYFILHALAAFDLMEADPNHALARRILHWIADQKLSSFSRRDCFNVFRRRIKDRVEALDPVLGILEAHGFVRRRAQEPRGRAGRPPAPIFDVNPLSAESAQSAKPTPRRNSADSADSAPIEVPATSNGRATGSGDWEQIA